MNLDREIANLALNLVEPQHKAEFTEAESEYRSLVEGFPIMLRTAGLLQSVSFLKAKGRGKGNEVKHPHGTLYQHLSAQFRHIRMLKDSQELASHLSDAKLVPMSEYRLYCQMADRIAYWHKRMAQAYLQTKKDGKA